LQKVGQRGGIGAAKYIENDIEIGDPKEFAVGTGELEEIYRGAGKKSILLFVVDIEGNPAFPDRFQEIGYFRFIENVFHEL
jgi:hypothetical protein